MYILIVGGGKVGYYLTKTLVNEGSNEVLLIEQDPQKVDIYTERFGAVVMQGRGDEVATLTAAGAARADVVIAVTGDDEDNVLICQMAKEKYLCERTIARVNNPRNMQHFELLGIQPAVSATDLILRLIEHEVPQYGLVHLLDLPAERLEIIEIEVTPNAPAAAKQVKDIAIPDGSLIISVLRGGAGFVPKADTVINAGDEVLLVLDPGLEPDITQQFAPNGARPR